MRPVTGSSRVAVATKAAGIMIRATSVASHCGAGTRRIWFMVTTPTT